MTGPIRTIWLLLAAAAATACNGSGASGASQAAAAARAGAAANASPGGIWHGLDGGDGSLSLMIAETGELKAFSEGPAFGSGAVVVTDGDRVAGSFDTRSVGAQPGQGAGPPGHCALEGEIIERVAMRVEVTCSLGDGAARHESRTLLFDSRYMSGSSPDAIAGNYTLPFDRLANSLTIADDGAVFGVYDNGARCTINGTARPVDGRFNLYRFAWQLANCAAPHERLEGAEFVGLGFRNPPGSAPGTLLLLLTGTVERRFEFLSLVYEPA